MFRPPVKIRIFESLSIFWNGKINVKHQFTLHTLFRGISVIYTNDITVFQNTAISLVV